MMFSNFLLFCLLFSHASAAPEPGPDMNIKIDIKVNGKSISGGSNGNGDQNNVKCGIEGPSATRIINGQPVNSPRKYSWQVGLSLSDSPSYDVECGGAIITNKHILTAAHCWPFGPGTKYYVGIGSNKQDNTSIIIHQAQVFLHKDYNPDTFDSDIAIIELSQPIDLLKNGISPVCIPKGDTNTYADTNAIVSGWGSTVGYNPTPTPWPLPSYPNILQEAQLPVISNTKCLEHVWVSELMLCAGDMKGFENGGKDSCQGDSGGPLTVQDNGQYEQIGVVSHGAGCASKGYPGVYTRVKKFLDWIKEKVAPEKIYTAS